MKIETAAKKFYKSINGKIEFENVEGYLRRLGYEVFFFNTAAGDAELARYGQTEKAKISKAFTYVGTAKIVFINNQLSVEDKLYVLLHEVGHIALKHLDYERLSAHNRILLDVDADAFVYFVLNRKRKPSLQAALLAVILVMAVCLFFRFPTESTFFSGDAPIISEASDTVIITASGRCYHRENCGTISGSLTANLERKEAQKLFSPCKKCNP